MNRREFVKSAAAVGYVAATGTALAKPSKDATFQMVAANDRTRILDAAQKYLANSPVTVTAFAAKHSAGGVHDFYSQGDYFWPNPKDPNGPYINRDGQSNPDNFDDHRRVMVQLSIQMPALTAAWLITGDARYSKKAADHLRAWFVTPETRMNPNLEYAQAIQNLNTGRSIGIIDTLHLVEVARAASHLGKVMSAADAEGVKQWFREYILWMTTSAKGKQERDTLNNHAMCWALQVAEFARLVDDKANREDCYNRYKTILMPNQLAADGSFPKELARTKPYGYSIFNFDVMTTLCQSLKGLEPDPLHFTTADGRGVCRAAEFIFPYLKDKNAWKWSHDIQHWDALPVRSPGLLFAGVACAKPEYIAQWKTMTADPTDKEVIRNNPIRQPLLWV